MPESLSIQVSTSQFAWLQNRDARRRYVVVLSPLKLSTSSVVSFHFTDSVWSDVETAQYRPLLKDNIVIKQSLPEDLIGGASVSGGSLSIDNVAGEFDGWLQNYSWGGRSIKIYGSDPDNAGWAELADYPLLFDGLIDRIEWPDGSKIVVRFTPETASANVDIFGHALTDNEERWPIVYGHVYNVPGKPYTDDTIQDTDRIYKISRYPVEVIEEVYVDASAQELDADYVDLAALDTAQALLTGGQYATCVAEGLFALHVSSAGAITCDVKGRNDSGPGYQDTAGEIVEDIAEDSARTGVTEEKFPQWVVNDTPFNIFKSKANQEIGFSLDAAENVLDLVGRVVASVGGIYWWDNHGEMCAAVMSDPVAAESQGTIHEELDIIGSVSVSAWQAPVYRYEIEFNRNYEPHHSEGLPTVVDLSQDFITNEWRSVAAVDQGTESNYADAQQIVEQSMIQQASHAAAEASRRLYLRSTPRFVFKLRAWNRNGGYAIFDTWQLLHSRVAPGGKYLRVISVSDNLTQQYTDLELWG